MLSEGHFWRWRLRLCLRRPQQLTDSTTATYLYGNAHASFDASEIAINASTASTLSLSWSTTRYWSTNQPIEAGGQVFWSDWNGILHATDITTHNDNWTANLGTTNSSCGGVTGPDSSATVATVGGVSTVYIGGGTAQVEALNAATGAVLWSTPLSADPAAFVWSSPALYNGSIYIGVASAASCPDVRGELVKLDALTGAIQATFYSVPEGCTGGGIWSSPTIDEATGVVYVGTGDARRVPVGFNGPAARDGTGCSSHCGLDASDLTLVGVYQPPDNGGDNDFGETPLLFDATVGSTTTQMVGALDKNGTYYALDRADLGAGPVWTHFIGVPGACGACTAEYSSNASYDGTTLYLAGDKGQIDGNSCPGTLSALDPATGTPIWADCLQQGRVLGAVTGAPGVVEVNAGDHVLLADDATGDILYDYTEPSGNYFWGPAYIADGVLYVSNNDGNLLAFTPSPPPQTPEFPIGIALPIAAVSPFAAYAVYQARRRKRILRPRVG